MNILVIGGGGREHAIIWKLSQSKDVDTIYCIPGNGGISDIAECVAMDVDNTSDLLDFSARKHIDLVIVGPENPLAEGIVDMFEKKGVPIFGPNKRGAMIEASKIFAKELMRQYGIPTAAFRVFDRYDDAGRYLGSLTPPYVIKADGLCAGKGAYVIQDQEEGRSVLSDLMVKGIHGDAGKKIIIEEFLPGIEASYLAFTDGTSMLSLLTSQDHKPLLDGDNGPNTGGMGAYTPIPFVNEAVERDIKARIMERTIAAMREKGIVYKGVLYGGLMLQESDPYVIEFNARLGDPETQPILFKMESDLLPILMACIEGKLHRINDIKWKEGVSICVVVASKGYPDKPEKGFVINGLERLKERRDVMVFHAGTKKADGRYYTSGGRVLGVTAIGSSYEDAMKRVYEAVSMVEFDGMHYRKDIGAKALAKKV
ncbi:MAG TPA: phosphoribosylamine--glycine ligase [Syntrophorhabdaceae bacterium]|nr:phosphoribosylamine--glycine ligase [Syntrophorhabdaceae bacterium]HQM81485.1 phosphoribosylamine--glycine ligase [Syntrophorhabdaceae bacterium]